MGKKRKQERHQKQKKRKQERHQIKKERKQTRHQRQKKRKQARHQKQKKRKHPEVRKPTVRQLRQLRQAPPQAQKPRPMAQCSRPGGLPHALQFLGQHSSSEADEFARFRAWPLGPKEKTPAP